MQVYRGCQLGIIATFTGSADWQPLLDMHSVNLNSYCGSKLAASLCANGKSFRDSSKVIRLRKSEKAKHVYVMDVDGGELI